jgi:hypothetical protein
MSKKKAMFFKQAVAGFTELYDFEDSADYTTETATVKTTNIGFGYWGLSNCSVESAGVGQADTTTAQNGDYCIKITNTGGGSNQRVETRIQVVAGDQYTIKVWAKEGTGLNQIAYWAGFVVTPSPVTVTGDWTEYTFNVEASATGTAYCRFYPQFSTATIGNHLYIDNISIEKTN